MKKFALIDIENIVLSMDDDLVEILGLEEDPLATHLEDHNLSTEPSLVQKRPSLVCRYSTLAAMIETFFIWFQSYRINNAFFGSA